MSAALSASKTSSVLSKYERLEKPVGEGTYGIVYKAKNIKTNEMVAMKKIRLDNEDEGMPSTALREISVLNNLIAFDDKKHPGVNNIVKLLDVEHTLVPSARLYLVFEWVNRDLKKFMDSFTHLELLQNDQENQAPNVLAPKICHEFKCHFTATKNKSSNLPPGLIQRLMYQLLLGMDYCHEKSLIHRDLKPQNILVDDFGNLKIADFGLARVFNVPFRSYTHEVVTLWYRAPEVLLGEKRYALPIDVWSIGAIFAELLNKKALWAGDCEIDELFKIFRTLGTPFEVKEIAELKQFNQEFPKWKKKDLSQLFSGVDTDVIDLLEKMFAYSPGARISCREAMSHDYFKDTLQLC